MLIDLDQLESSTDRFALLKQKTTKNREASFTEAAFASPDAPEITEHNILGAAENIARRKKMIGELKKEPLEFAYERAIGKNDSVYSNFVDLLSNAKQKVGRIAVKNGIRELGSATGFMVSEKLMLTNWHVFKTKESVIESEIQFNYELDTNGNGKESIAFKLNEQEFYHSNKDFDYCFVAVNEVDVTGRVRLNDIGYIFLDPTLGKVGNEKEELLNIIHHPDGDYKQLSIRENMFVKITPTAIWYQSDTAPGSSGSPVFNDQWQVVALHHMGIGQKNESGDYIDKNGNVVPRTNGEIDETQIVWIANEGIRISVILTDIFSKFPNAAIVNGLKKSPLPNVKPLQKPAPEIPFIPTKQIPMESNVLSNYVNISFPASLVETNGTVNVSISNKSSSGVLREVAAHPDSTLDESMAEIKKLEESIDFSDCKGYQSKFLGFDIPLPLPQKGLKKFIAKLQGTDSYVLKYHHYSVIFHSVRMMPIISAINVDGDPEKRLDESKRKDNWLRDRRLDFDIQLSDSYYKGSGFDRGHMSRREDANWGSTAENAKLNADMTCLYTNACPQVATLNQSGRKGLWGILEKIVLEEGAVKEAGKTARISVFNGPIFKDSDQVFKGIQVPLEFYKIILWLTDEKQLRATAFKLSQEKLVDDIDFEQLDIDQNLEFKEHQCSIEWLQKVTKLDLSSIIQFDTFKGEGEELVLKSENEVKLLIAQNRKSK
jgi:endonuclease G